MTMVFLSLGAIAITGALLRRIFPNWNIDDFRKSINMLVLYVLLPALVFKVIYTSELSQELYQVPLAVAAGVFGCLGAAWLVIRWAPIANNIKGPLILASAFGNVTYLGLPVLQGVFANQGLDVSKVAILCEVTVAPLNLIAGSMLAMSFSENKDLGFVHSLKQVAKLPPIWALVIALAAKYLQIPLPTFLLHATQVLGAAVPGLMVLSLGMALQFQRINHLGPILAVSGIKLFLSPMIVFSVGGLMAMNDTYLQALTIEGAMPTQLLTLVIADRFKLDTKPLAQAILINTIVAFFTIPLIRWMLF